MYSVPLNIVAVLVVAPRAVTVANVSDPAVPSIDTPFNVCEALLLPNDIDVVPTKNDELANIALVILPFAIVVVFPVLVTTPVKLALVVTVAELPDMLPCNEPVNAVDVTDVKPPNVIAVAPKLIAVVPIVSDELLNLLFSIDPANIAFVTPPVAIESVLVAAIVPPPVKPLPGLIDTVVWSMCWLAT